VIGQVSQSSKKGFKFLKESKVSDKSSNDIINDAIEEFLNNGGEVVRLRYASQKDQSKAQRRVYHEDKATAGSERSKDALAREDAKEKTMIFSKTDRWKEE
jgi:hypothetical protein